MFFDLQTAGHSIEYICDFLKKSEEDCNSLIRTRTRKIERDAIRAQQKEAESIAKRARIIVPKHTVRFEWTDELVSGKQCEFVFLILKYHLFISFRTHGFYL
jgi:hypothetical protein